MWANGMRIAGGRNTIMQNNLITDPTSSNGIRVGKFGTAGNPCESALVSNNLIIRGCGIRNVYGQAGICVGDTATASIQTNTIIDSHAIGIEIQRCNATFNNNIIENPSTQGFLVKSGSIGTGTFVGNTIRHLRLGQVAFRNDAPATFTVSSWGNSWQPTGLENKNSSKNESNIYLSNNQNRLNIKDVNGSINVQISNISGQIIFSALSSGEVDISKLIPGIYMISIENHKPQRFVKSY
jgi:hypothetical protein